MINEYHRPKDLEDALSLLARGEPTTRPLAGGSVLNQATKQEFAIVDLQDLGLDNIEQSGNFLKMGATLTLEGLSYEFMARTPADRPLVCAVMAIWPSGRTRLALGGLGVLLSWLLMGQKSMGFLLLQKMLIGEAWDEWATAEYRSEIAGVLTSRCVEPIGKSIF